jgi:thiamine-phosphate pyrophosphorylase
MDKADTQRDYGLYLVTDSKLSLGRHLSYIVEEAVRGGVTVVQLREKNLSFNDFVSIGKEVKAILGKYKVPMLINDRVDVALAAGADGVHLGQSDMPYNQAREILGKKAIIGLSVESMDQVSAANNLDVDYIAISPVFLTPTKTDTLVQWGLDGIERVKRCSDHLVVAIGGINEDNVKDVISAGADGIAVVSAICSAPDPRESARRLQQKINREIQHIGDKE